MRRRRLRETCSYSTISSTSFAAARAIAAAACARWRRGRRLPATEAIRTTRVIFLDENGDPWGVWNPALVGLPNHSGHVSDYAVHQGHLSSIAR